MDDQKEIIHRLHEAQEPADVIRVLTESGMSYGKSLSRDAMTRQPSSESHDKQWNIRRTVHKTSP